VRLWGCYVAEWRRNLGSGNSRGLNGGLRSSLTTTLEQTIAAIGFPIIIMLLVPLRVFVVPRLGFSKEELDILDGPVASPFVSDWTHLILAVVETVIPGPTRPMRPRPTLMSQCRRWSQLGVHCRIEYREGFAPPQCRIAANHRGDLYLEDQVSRVSRVTRVTRVTRCMHARPSISSNA
jgi:hypothetical protein